MAEQYDPFGPFVAVPELDRAPAGSQKKIFNKPTDLFKGSTSDYGPTYRTTNPDGTAGNAMRWDYVPPEGGIQPADRFGQYLGTLSNDYAALMAERDRQVARSGASAGAPYDRAIARINAEMNRLREQQARFAEISANQLEQQDTLYDTAQTDLAARQPERIADLEEAFGGVHTEASKHALTTSPAAQAAAADLATIGASEESTVAVVEAIDAVEDEVMGYNELVAQNTRNYVERVMDITSKALEADQSERGYMISTDAELVQARIEDQIMGMIEEKQELQAKRSAAVSAARNATLAQFPEGLQWGAEGFMDVNLAQFGQDLAKSGKLKVEDIPLFNQMAAMVHLSPAWNDTQNLRSVPNLKAIFFPQPWNVQEEHDRNSMLARTKRGNEIKVLNDAEIEFANMVAAYDPVTRRNMMYSVIQGAQLLDEASNFYNSQVVGSDPTTLVPGSILRAFSVFENEMSNNAGLGMSMGEAWDYATSSIAHQTYNPPSARDNPYESLLGLGGFS